MSIEQLVFFFEHQITDCNPIPLYKLFGLMEVSDSHFQNLITNRVVRTRKNIFKMVFNPEKKPFRTIQQIFIGLDIHPHYARPNMYIKALSILIAFVIFTIQFCSLISDLVFIQKTLGNDLESSLCVLFQLAATSNACCILTITFMKRNEIIVIFKKFENIQSASKFGLKIILKQL